MRPNLLIMAACCALMPSVGRVSAFRCSGRLRRPATALYAHRSDEQRAANAAAMDPSSASVGSLPDDEWVRQDLEAQLRDHDPKPRDATTDAIKIIFSDIDGSLIHYPKQQPQQRDDDDDGNEILQLPPSATGMRGIVSSRTLALCQDLRIESGVKLVLVTGARTSTLLNRLPYLPKADAYCTEAGGRIFYPTDDVGCCEANGSEFVYAPVDYSGASDEDLQPFGLREDMSWRKRMVAGGAGTEAFLGNEVSSPRCHGASSLDGGEDAEECLIDYESIEGFPQDAVPVAQRDGCLWDFARRLVEEERLVLDTKSYSTCFRVNMKHQQGSSASNKFDALLSGEISHPEENIGKSTNLGCVDFYPAVSGKRNCCEYIASNLGFDLATESVCICDDDNDTEMALACSHSFVPTLTSQSMVDNLRRHGSNFTLTFGPGVSSTDATEAALISIRGMTS